MLLLAEDGPRSFGRRVRLPQDDIGQMIMIDIKHKIYFDHAATTPADKEVVQAMADFWSVKFGNPSSLHWAGQEAQSALIKARGQVAEFFGSLPQEIIFTSGATESDNLALRGVVLKAQQQRPNKAIHIITTKIEHHAILETAHSLEKQSIDATYLSVDKQGLVGLKDLEQAIRPETILVSVMYVNNEVGTIQPIVAIGELLAKINQERAQQKLPKIIFHTDAVQAINYLDCNVKTLGVDLLSLSGHKIYGPKGVGVLYVRQRTPLERIQDGGPQEYNLRAGTHNVLGIVGLAEAIKRIKNLELRIKDTEKLRDDLVEGVLKNISDCQLNGSREDRVLNNANFSFRGVEGESLLIALDQVGIAVSTGSACASRSLEPSHVLTAMGCTPDLAHSSLRLTLGKDNTQDEVGYFLQVLPEIIARLRKISGSR